MAQFTGEDRVLDRRGFLKGSAMFAAAAVGIGLASTPLFAQDSQAKTDEQKKAEEEAKAKAEAEKAKDGSKPAGNNQAAAKQDPNKLYDKNGIEYRVCERCGGNMYLEEKTWTCEQCGLTYVE